MQLFLPPTLELFSTPVPGEVETPISRNRPGRVKCLASHWSAKLYQSDTVHEIAVGQVVTVVGREGIMLLVKPD